MVSIPLSRMSAPNAIKTPAMLGNQPRLYRGGAADIVKRRGKLIKYRARVDNVAKGKQNRSW